MGNNPFVSDRGGGGGRGLTWERVSTTTSTGYIPGQGKRNEKKKKKEKFFVRCWLCSFFDLIEERQNNSQHFARRLTPQAQHRN